MKLASNIRAKNNSSRVKYDIPRTHLYPKETHLDCMDNPHSATKIHVEVIPRHTGFLAHFIRAPKTFNITNRQLRRKGG